jgi:4-oxalomesaconate tautomerase
MHVDAGGTSKGGYFLASDLPGDPATRDKALWRSWARRTPVRSTGWGGADPLTSKVAVVSKSVRPGIDVDYLFLQVWVDKAGVSDAQNCGNILAGVAPFAIERGLVRGCDPVTKVRIFMVNSSQTVVATVQTPGGQPRYDGSARIDGVPGTAAPIPLSFSDTAGSTCGALLPTGRRWM